MYIYYILFLGVCLLSFVILHYQGRVVFALHSNSKRSITPKQLYVFIIFLSVSFIVGFRGLGVGIDTLVYYKYYETALNGHINIFEGIQIVRPIIEFICAKLHFPAALYFFAVASLTSYFIFKYMLEMSKDVFISIIIYLGMFFVQSMNIMDTWLALSFGLGALVEYNKKHTKRALCFLILSCLTHISAVVMLLYFLFYKIKNKKKALVVFIFLGLVFICVKDMLMRFIVYLVPQYSSYYYGGRYGQGGVSIEKILLYLIILVAIFYILFSKKKMLTAEEVSNFYTYAAFVVLAIVFSIAANSLLYMNRLVYYFGITIVVCVPAVLDKFPLKHFTKIVVVLAMFFLLYRNESVDSSGISNYTWYWQ